MFHSQDHSRTIGGLNKNQFDLLDLFRGPVVPSAGVTLERDRPASEKQYTDYLVFYKKRGVFKC